MVAKLRKNTELNTHRQIKAEKEHLQPFHMTAITVFMSTARLQKTFHGLKRDIGPKTSSDQNLSAQE